MKNNFVNLISTLIVLLVLLFNINLLYPQESLTRILRSNDEIYCISASRDGRYVGYGYLDDGIPCYLHDLIEDNYYECELT